MQRIICRSYSEPLTRGSVFESREAGPFFLAQECFTGSGERTPYRLVFRAMDVSENERHHVEFVFSASADNCSSLPDVLVFNPLYVRLAYFYRRRLGVVLLRDKEDRASSGIFSSFVTISHQK